MTLKQYRYRFFLVLALLPVMILLAWRISFSQTLSVYQELREFEQSLQQYPHPEHDLARLKQQLLSMNADDTGDRQTVDDILLEKISSGSEHYGFQLVEFPESHHYAGTNYSVQTFRVRLSGRFSGLLKFIHEAEYQLNVCRLVSVDFIREYQRKSGERLYVDLYFQSISKTKQ